MAWGSIGWIVLGLGMFGLGNENPADLHPIFADRSFDIGLLVVGGIIAVAHVIVVVSERLGQRR
jgi:hypothetical protein